MSFRPWLVAVLLLVAAPLSSASAATLSWSMPEPVAQGHALNAVACPSAILYIAVGDGGRVVISAHPAGGAGTWTSASLDRPNRLLGVSCPSTAFCAAISNRSQVVASTNPTGGAGAWHAALIDRGRWLNEISCPSIKLCVVVDRRGGVVTASNPGGGAHAWKRVQVSRIALTGISCPSTRLCVATEQGQKVLVSTHPTGGARAWHAVSADPGFGNVLNGVSCPSAQLCVAVDDSQNSSVDALSSSNPTRRQQWRGATLDDVAHVGHVITRVGCAPRSLCVIVDNGDAGAMNAFVSTQPAAPKWSTDSPALPGSDSSAFTGVACTTGPLCVITTSGGTVIVGM